MDRAAGEPGLPASVLLVSMQEIGWRTAARELEGALRSLGIAVQPVPIEPTRLAQVSSLPRTRTGRFEKSYRRVRARERQVVRALTNVPTTSELAIFVPHLLAPTEAPIPADRSVAIADCTVTQATSAFTDEPLDSVRDRHERLLSHEIAALERLSGVLCMSRWAMDGFARERPGLARALLPPGLSQPPAGRIRGPRRGDDRRLFFVGHNFDRKGGRDLVSWHQEHLIDDYELHICSRGAASDVGRLPRVVLHREVSRERLMNELLPSAHVLALPTRKDMSPWILVEAAHLGIPVVATSIGGISEIVRDGHSGFLAEVADASGFITALRRLAREPGLREQMARAARQHAIETLSLERTLAPSLSQLRSRM